MRKSNAVKMDGQPIMSFSNRALNKTVNCKKESSSACSKTISDIIILQNKLVLEQ